MHNSRRLVPLALFITLLLAGFSIVAAHDAEPGQADVRLTFKIVNSSLPEKDATRTYQMVVTPSDRWVTLTQGYRVPIPTTSFNTQDAEGGAIVPVTSFSYQNVGFSAHIMVSVLTDGRIQIRGKVEDSSLSSRKGVMGHPIITAMNQSLDATLRDGETTRIAWVESTQVGSMFLEIAAEILN